MKFYKRFPGDITIKTGDLSLTEFGAYDRLLDHYYAKETPIDPKKVYTVTRCQTAADRRAVDAVLLEYWTLTPLGWVQQRADEMIAEALPKIAAARENGKKGGRPTKDEKAKRDAFKEPTGFSMETQDLEEEKTSQSQNQNGSESKDSAEAGATAAVDKSTNTEPPVFDKRWLWDTARTQFSAGGIDAVAAGEFIGALVKDFTQPVAIEAMRSALDAKPFALKGYLTATCKAIKAKPAGGQYETAAETRARLDADSRRTVATPAQAAAHRARIKAGEPS